MTPLWTGPPVPVSWRSVRGGGGFRCPGNDSFLPFPFAVVLVLLDRPPRLSLDISSSPWDKGCRGARSSTISAAWPDPGPPWLYDEQGVREGSLWKTPEGHQGSKLALNEKARPEVATAYRRTDCAHGTQPTGLVNLYPAPV